MKFFFFFFLIFFLLMVLLFAVFFVSFSIFLPFLEKGGPFECGFQSFSGLNFSFSFPFFAVSMVFVLFDVEILLICLYPLLSFFDYFLNFFIWSLVVLVFFATLYEWMGGILSWF